MAGAPLLSGGAVWREHYSRRVMLLEKHYSPGCASPTVFTAIWARDPISEPKNMILLTFPIGFGRESWFLVPLIGPERSGRQILGWSVESVPRLRVILIEGGRRSCCCDSSRYGFACGRTPHARRSLPGALAVARPRAQGIARLSLGFRV